MKNIIVVTGGAGFIGSHLIKFFIKQTNFSIISIDNYFSGSVDNHIKNGRIKYIKGNTDNIDKLLHKFKSKINTIFHFGEFSRIDQSFDDVVMCMKSNIAGTVKVFNFCLDNKIKIIYSATSASLGNSGADQYLSPYSFSKSKNLKLLIQLNKWFGLKYEVLYFYNVYGSGQIGTGKMATVIGIFENQFLNKKSLTVVRPGSQSRKFTHIDDTVRGCYIAWKKNLNRHYALSNNQSYSIMQVAKMFKAKIVFIKKKRGERFKSSIVSKANNIKIHKIPCLINLKQYISEFLKKSQVNNF